MYVPSVFVPRALLASCLFASFSACFPVPPDVPWRPTRFVAASLLGEWHVVATNFPMWLDGERCDPRFRYERLPDVDGNFRMSDEVSYLAPGENTRDTLTGFDVQNQDNPVHFTWRGDGILALFTSEWFVAWVDPTCETAIIYFTETPATPAGVDVITRGKAVSAAARADALQVVAGDAFLASAAEGLVWLDGEDPRVPAACRTPAAR